MLAKWESSLDESRHVFVKNRTGIEISSPKKVQIKEIDLEASLKTQARLEDPLDQTTVDQYAQDMKNGDVFPCLILRKITLPNGKYKYVVYDGNHRLHSAIKIGDKEIQAQIFETDNEQKAATVARTINKPGGKTSTWSHMVQHAIELVKNGMTLIEASRVTGIPRNTISTKIDSEKTMGVLTKAGITANSNLLPQLTLSELKKLENQEPVMIATAKLIRDAKLPSDNAKILIEELLSDKGSEARKLVFLEDKRKELVADMGHGISKTVRKNRVYSNKYKRLLMKMLAASSKTLSQNGIQENSDVQSTVVLLEKIQIQIATQISGTKPYLLGHGSQSNGHSGNGVSKKKKLVKHG